MQLSFCKRVLNWFVCGVVLEIARLWHVHGHGVVDRHEHCRTVLAGVRFCNIGYFGQASTFFALEWPPLPVRYFHLLVLFVNPPPRFHPTPSNSTTHLIFMKLEADKC